MLNNQDFEIMIKEYHKYDSHREQIIIKSRELIKLSKQVIYSVHRNNLDQANIGQMKKSFDEILALAKKDQKLLEVGAFKVAIGEYVEAMLYYSFIKNKKIPTHKELKVTTDNYLFGLCDLPGELNRKAVFLAGKGKAKEVETIRDIVDEIYGILLKFDIRDNELRRKVDSVKYELAKLEDLVLKLKIK